MAGGIGESCKHTTKEEVAMGNASKVRLGLIGCGAVGVVHAQSIAEADASELVIVADIDKEAASSVSRRFGVKQVTTDVKDVVSHPLLDGVVVAIPSHLHADVVVEAAKAGKHVFCEKPLAMTLADADRMIDACKEAGVLLQVGFVMRFAEPRQRLKQLIQSGILGRPIVFRVFFPLMSGDQKQWMHRLDEGGGPFIEGGIHHFDHLRTIFGEVESVYAAALGIKPEEYSGVDTGTAIVKFRSQDTLVYSVCWGLPGLEGYGDMRGGTRYDIIGSKGYALFPALDGTPVMSFNCYEDGSEKNVAELPWPNGWGAGGDAYRGEIAHFVACIQKNEVPMVTGEDGRKALEIGLKVLESARTGQVLRFDS